MNVRILWFLMSGILALTPILQGASAPPPTSKTKSTLSEERLYKHTPFVTAKPQAKAASSAAISENVQKYLLHSHPAAFKAKQSALPQPSPPARRAPTPISSPSVGY